MSITPERDDRSLGDSTTVNEETPLLHSESSSTTLPPRTSPDDVENAADAFNDGQGPQHSISSSRVVAIALSMFVLIFLQASNMSGLTMIQSTIAADLDSYEEAIWFTSSYLIAMSSLAPLIGRLASIFSPKVMILASSVMFTIGGLISAVAPTFAVFILGRVFTGMGGAGIMVLALILVLELASKESRGLYIGLVNAGFTTGISLGAVVYGALISTTSWRVLFGVQVPLGFIAGLGVYFSIPHSFTPNSNGSAKEDSVATKLKKIDYLGAVALSGTIVLLLYSLSGNLEILPIILSAVTFVAFVLIEFYVAKDPLIPLVVLKSRGALLSCLSQLGFMAARWTVLFYAPITVLAVRGFSPGAAGSMLIPTNLGFGLGGLLVGWLHIKRSGSFYLASVLSILLFSATLLALSFSSGPDVPLALYIFLIFANGLTTGAEVNYCLAHMLHLTPADTHYVGTSLLGTFRGFAGSFGSAIGGGIFVRTLRQALTAGFEQLDGSSDLSPARQDLIKKLIGSPALVFHDGLNGLEQHVAIQGYVGSLSMLFRAALILSLAMVVLQAFTGWKSPSSKQGSPDEIAEIVAEHGVEGEA